MRLRVSRPAHVSSSYLKERNPDFWNKLVQLHKDLKVDRTVSIWSDDIPEGLKAGSLVRVTNGGRSIVRRIQLKGAHKGELQLCEADLGILGAAHGKELDLEISTASEAEEAEYLCDSHDPEEQGRGRLLVSNLKIAKATEGAVASAETTTATVENLREELANLKRQLESANQTAASASKRERWHRGLNYVLAIVSVVLGLLSLQGL